MSQTIDGPSRVLQGIKGDYYIVREVVAKTGISESTLRRAIRNNTKEMMPSKVVIQGREGKIYLYTPADIERIVNFYSQRYTPKDFDGELPLTGRPRKYTEQQRKERARLHSKANYWKTKAANLRRDRKRKEAQEAERRYKEIRKELDEQG